MKKEFELIFNVIKRVIAANLNGEHYWFIIRPVYVQNDKGRVKKSI